MLMIYIFIANFVWILYSIVEGFRDGFFYHFKRNSRRGTLLEVSPLINIQRSLILLLISFFLSAKIGILVFIFAMSFILMFSFIYNGSYYYTRHKLNDKMYPMLWKDEELYRNSKLYSKLMNYRHRTIIMTIGVLLQVFTYMFLIK
jgi:hypothetical protein